MRVSFGKRIGGIYCGISKNINGITGVIIALFAMCFVIPIVASFYLLYYFFKGVIWCIQKINEATSEWRMLHRVLLWTGIILFLLLVGLLYKSSTSDEKPNQNNITISNTVKTTTALKVKKTTKTTTPTKTTTVITTTTDTNGDMITYQDISFEVFCNMKEKLKYDEITRSYACWHDDNYVGSISFRTHECNNSDVAKEMLEFELETYSDFSNHPTTEFEVNGVKIYKATWHPTNHYSNTYIFEYNNIVYIIDFSENQEHRNECSVYKNSDDMINTLKFKGKAKVEETTETETEEVVDEQEEVAEEVVETEAEVVETDPPTEDPNESITVYKTPTGEKYHYDGNCNGGSYSECTLAYALRIGLEPCGKCVN